MKKLILALAFLSILTSLESCETQKVVVNREVETENYGKMLLGRQTLSQFEKEPYSQWYSENYDEYEVDEEAIKTLKKEKLDRYNLTVFLGTWCGDSKREFPRLMKILDRIGFPESKLTIIGVNRKKESPGGKATLNGIKRVPTIIVERYGKELGRIIEMPKSGFIEKDLVEILQKDNDSAIKGLFKK